MKIPLEVVYALPDEQVVVELELESPVTIREAIAASGLLGEFPQIKLEDNMVGVFGYHHSLDHALSPGDRVEIYRPLTMSPVEARRLRAASRTRGKKSS